MLGQPENVRVLKRAGTISIVDERSGIGSPNRGHNVLRRSPLASFHVSVGKGEIAGVVVVFGGQVYPKGITLESAVEAEVLEILNVKPIENKSDCLIICNRAAVEPIHAAGERVCSQKMKGSR